MGVQGSLEKACAEVRLLRVAVDELAMAILEDQPTPSVHAELGDLEERAREMKFVCDDLEAVLQEVCRQCGQPLNEAGLRRGLESGSNLFARLLELFTDLDAQARLLASEALRDGKPAREWRRWMEVVQTDLAQCLPYLGQCARSLLKCWAEIAERLSPLPTYLLAAG